MSNCEPIFSSAGTVSSLRGRIFLGLALLTVLVGTVAFSGSLPDATSQKVHGEADLETQTAVENLRAFARLYGYVKYFHPSDAASAVDWNRLAIHGVQQVREAATPDELRERLTALFAPIAPTVQIYPASEAPPPPAEVLTPADTAGLDLVAWQHQGVDLENQGPYRSIRLNREARIRRGPGFGPFTQSIDAEPYRGKRVRLQAAVRADVTGNGNQAQLWLRIDGPEGQQRFLDNMGDRPITASDWDVYQITGPVAEDAERVVFGGFLLGSGMAYFDDFQLSVREDADEAWTPVSIENAGFEDGETLTGWGAQAQGYAFATEQEDAYEGEWSLVIESAETSQAAEPLFEARPAAGEVVSRPLGRGLSAQIPLALYSNDEQTLRPDGAPPPDDLHAALEDVRLDALSASDEALRYGNVIIAWNVFQHFYPYFDVVDVDWDEVLTRTLQRAGSDSSDEDFLPTLQWMVAQLDDGHGRVFHPVMQERAGLPFRVERVEDRIAVVAVSDSLRAADEACIRRGDVVVSVDDVPVEEVMQEVKPYISGSPQWKEVRALNEWGQGERGTTAHLVLERGDRQVECSMPRNFDDMLREDRPPPIEEIQSGVYYVDLTRAESNAIQEHMDLLAEASGIVFDMRGYPQSGNAGILQHLSADTLRSAHWQTPQIIYPDRENLVGYDTTGRWTLLPEEPQLEGPLVFLTDARALSQAESIMGIVEHYRLGEIVGRPTAGVNGDVNPFVLPGNYRVSWTGRRVVKHDGSQHHLVGIEPTVPVERTIEGVREGRDEDLEVALEVIESPSDAAGQ